jgi:hypothetical protein
MRDSGEHFPAFNVAIRHHGVKKSGEGDFLGANYLLEIMLTFVCGLRRGA